MGSSLSSVMRLFADDRDVCVVVDKFFDFLRTESSFAADLVELIQAVVESLPRVRNRAGEDWELVDCADKSMLKTEFNKFPLVNVLLSRRQSNAKRF